MILTACGTQHTVVKVAASTPMAWISDAPIATISAFLKQKNEALPHPANQSAMLLTPHVTAMT
jgi:hypothetical protein